jgi:hypothetical protein
MNRKISILKIILTIILASYLLYYMTNLSEEWHFIDNVNLIFHEAGHVIFSFFGDFIHTLGGTLMQLLIPATFSFYFYKNGEYFSASLLLFWLSQNFFNVYIYANDAINMDLSLLGGDNVYHDWNHMLTSLNLLNYTDKISSGLYSIGLIVFIFAVIFSFKYSIEKD